MAEISNLKLKLTAVEKDRLDYEDRFRDTEVSDNTPPHIHTPVRVYTSYTFFQNKLKFLVGVRGRQLITTCSRSSMLLFKNNL